MRLIERHGTVSWGGEEFPEPPYPGKVHLIIEDTHAPIEHCCTIACGLSSKTEEFFVDFVDAPITCKRCLRMTPQGIRRRKVRIMAARVW